MAWPRSFRLATVVPGELSFAWILDGMAIQDVWRVPLDSADASRMRAFYGTTIRFYDAAIAAWRSMWIDPLNGRVRRFIGRLLDDTIVLDGIAQDPKERWTFRDIAADSFVWRGESSVDGGKRGLWRIRCTRGGARPVSPPHAWWQHDTAGAKAC